MNKIIINGGNARYLSELPEFQNGLPFGVINKTKTDVGGTYVAVNCNNNYIIVCPFKDLVDSIAADKNNKYNVFKCYGGTKEYEWLKYSEDNVIKKIAVTYDSLYKIVNWIGDINNYKILIDEYQLIIEDMDYRYDAIDSLMSEVVKFKHYSFLSATPVDEKYEIEFIRDIPHYKVIWDDYFTINPIRIKSSSIYKGTAKFIKTFLEEGVEITDIYGNMNKVEELYVFINSVKGIKQILDTLNLPETMVKVCCAERIRNRKVLGNYDIEPVYSPNKTINFFTKKCFQGCNLFTNNGLIIVCSDGNKDYTLVDVSTTLEQIVGRLRTNENYQNVFANVLVHIFSTNNKLLNNEEFEELMNEKERKANLLISGQSKLTKEELNVYLERINLETDIVSIIKGNIVYNELKKQSFLYKQELRQSYRNGITIRKKFNDSEKFKVSNQINWSDLEIKLAKSLTISYQELLSDYLSTTNGETYELEYPEFILFKKHLSYSEMNTMRWNKEKMLKAVADKQLLDKVYYAIYKSGFISSKELKDKFKAEFKKRNINLTPKASLIENCTLYKVTKCNKRINGEKTNGYELNGLIYTVKI